MLRVATTACDDLLKNVLEGVHEVDKLLRALIELGDRPRMQVDCALQDQVLLLLNHRCRLLQLVLGD